MNNREKKQTKQNGERKDRRSDQSKWRSTREQAVFLYFLIVFILVSIHLDRGNAPDKGVGTPMSADWTTEAGDIVDLSELPPGNLDLTKDVGGMKLGRKSLCLKSIDTVFDVYADGKQIYSYRPSIPQRLGVSYGMNVHAVAIPEDVKVLGMRLEPVFPDTPAAVGDVVIEDGGQYMTDLFRNNLWAFGRSSVILFVGLLFLAIGVFGKIIMNNAGLDFISFGMLCVLIGFTGYNDTLILQVLPGHPSIIRVITYVCLIFLPYPALSFFASATGSTRSKLVPASLVMALANFAAQVFLTHRGISDYYYMVNISHGIIILAFLATGYLLIRAIRQHTIQKELLRSLTIGLAACAIGVYMGTVRDH